MMRSMRHLSDGLPLFTGALLACLWLAVAPALAEETPAASPASGELAAPAQAPSAAAVPSARGEPPAEAVPPSPPGAKPPRPIGQGPQAGRFPKLNVERLEKGRFRIGKIEGDRRTGRVTVPGRVLRDQPPLEFLAVRVGGAKAYEALLELDADAYEFNLACILVGFDPKLSRPPRFHFDPDKATGDAAELRVQWEQDGVTEDVPAVALLAQGGKPVKSNLWVYTGSRFARDGRYLAQQDGTLIGFAHDPASIIEHRDGIGLGDYGSVAPMAEALPPIGTAIRLTVERVAGGVRRGDGKRIRPPGHEGGVSPAPDPGAGVGNAPQEPPAQDGATPPAGEAAGGQPQEPQP